MGAVCLHRKQFFKTGIPYWVFVNQRAVGFMKGREAYIQLPEGTWEIGVKMVFQVWKWQFSIGTTETYSLAGNEELNIWVTDREKWWDILFNIDLVVWLASFLFTLPQPWDTVYEVLSEGFFAIWLLRIWIIRNHYFKFIKKEGVR